MSNSATNGKGNTIMIKGVSNSVSYKIQVLRGLAIVAVVLIHNSPKGIAQVWFRPFINFSVGLFLFLSGLLSDIDSWSPKKRIIKVIIPYVIWTAVYVLIYNYRDFSRILLYRYFKSLLLADSEAIMYYVFVYCELTLLIPIIDKLSKSSFIWIGFLISPLEILFMRLIPLMAGYELNDCISKAMHISCVGWFIYFYLGYLLGNGRITIKSTSKELAVMWVGTIILQILEGYWYLYLGEQRCGVQLKLSSVLSGVVFMLLAYKYIESDQDARNKVFKLLGDKSFGVFFIHLAVMTILKKIPYYESWAIFPVNAFITTGVSLICVIVGGIIFGKYAKYFAF